MILSDSFELSGASTLNKSRCGRSGPECFPNFFNMGI